MIRTIVLPNFTNPDELKCSCGCGLDTKPRHIIALQAFIIVLERIYQGKVTYHVTGGARCQNKNGATAGSSDFSWHIPGLATDGVFMLKKTNGSIGEQIPNADVACAAIRSGLFGGVGYVRYHQEGKNLVHLDSRPDKDVVTW